MVIQAVSRPPFPKAALFLCSVTPAEVKCLVFFDLLSLCIRIVCFSLQQDVAISPKQRDEVIQWLAKLKYQFHLYPETLALAISLLDRFLATVKVNICRYIN